MLGALITALVPIFSQLLAGASVSEAFSALTIIQWASIGAALVNIAQPEINAELAKLHPLFDQFIKDLEKSPPAEAAANAVLNVENFFKTPVQQAESDVAEAWKKVGDFFRGEW